MRSSSWHRWRRCSAYEYDSPRSSATASSSGQRARASCVSPRQTSRWPATRSGDKARYGPRPRRRGTARRGRRAAVRGGARPGERVEGATLQVAAAGLARRLHASSAHASASGICSTRMTASFSAISSSTDARSTASSRWPRRAPRRGSAGSRRCPDGAVREQQQGPNARLARAAATRAPARAAPSAVGARLRRPGSSPRSSSARCARRSPAASGAARARQHDGVRRAPRAAALAAAAATRRGELLVGRVGREREVQRARLLVGRDLRQRAVQLALLARARAGSSRRRQAAGAPGARRSPSTTSTPGVDGVVERGGRGDAPRSCEVAEVAAQRDGEQQPAHRGRAAPRRACPSSSSTHLGHGMSSPIPAARARASVRPSSSANSGLPSVALDDAAQHVPRQRQPEPLGQQPLRWRRSRAGRRRGVRARAVRARARGRTAARALAKQEATGSSVETAGGEGERLGRSAGRATARRRPRRAAALARRAPAARSGSRRDRGAAPAAAGRLGPQQRDLERQPLRRRQAASASRRRRRAGRSARRTRAASPRRSPGRSAPGGRGAGQVDPGLPERRLPGARLAGEEETAGRTLRIDERLELRELGFPGEDRPTLLQRRLRHGPAGIAQGPQARNRRPGAAASMSPATRQALRRKNRRFAGFSRRGTARQPGSFTPDQTLKESHDTSVRIDELVGSDPGRAKNTTMKGRLSVALSTTAPVVAVFGSTPLGHAVAEAVPPLAIHAKTADYVTNAGAVNGIKASRQPLPGRLAALGRDGRFPASVGATGPQGPKGEPGAQGPPGPTGNGAEGLHRLARTTRRSGERGPSGISGWAFVTEGFRIKRDRAAREASPVRAARRRSAAAWPRRAARTIARAWCRAHPQARPPAGWPPFKTMASPRSATSCGRFAHTSRPDTSEPPRRPHTSIPTSTRSQHQRQEAKP